MGLDVGLEECHAIVTGGTRGMGRSFVETFLRNGVNVSHCARKVAGDEFAEFTNSLRGSQKPRAVGTPLNVGSKQDVDTWLTRAASEFGRIDIVIANGASPLYMDGETEHWHESFNIDLMGFVNLFAAAAPFLEKSPHASALVISSFMGREYYRSPPTCYGPLKAAQLQYVQELSQFYGSKGVRINAISPGPIMAKGGPWEYMQQTSPDWVEEQRLKIPLRRLGGPEEVANVGLVSVQPVELLYLRHERLGRRWHPRRNAVLRIGMWEDA